MVLLTHGITATTIMPIAIISTAPSSHPFLTINGICSKPCIMHNSKWTAIATKPSTDMILLVYNLDLPHSWAVFPPTRLNAHTQNNLLQPLNHILSLLNHTLSRFSFLRTNFSHNSKDKKIIWTNLDQLCRRYHQRISKLQVLTALQTILREEALSSNRWVVCVNFSGD